jgi:(1->4)-alpha-D-glucan 1-alpha-D-glucosylmutase
VTEPFVATASDDGPEVMTDPGAVTDPDQYSEYLPRTPRPPAVVPVSTYRLQIRPGFGFDDAAAVVGHLHSLGITHLYLSPVLQPAPASVHGYDVVDHARLNQEAGGRAAFDRLSAVLSEHGMSAIADVVPNHMCVPRPARLNAALWSVLREGPASPFARWFDVDWSIPSRPILMPVLGRRIGQVLADDELRVDTDGSEPVLRYFDYEFPIRPGTERLPIEQLVDRQWYRLAWWRVADDELNYRRFFDVDTLVAIRVEDREVFDASHALLIDLIRSGQLQGLRIDHPDGLANPRDYLGRLAEAAGDPWVVVEKILTGEETLPADWCCSGTTGYDALLVVGGLFLDPAGAAPLTALLTDLTGDPPDFSVVVEEAKRQVVTANLYAEVARLVDLLVAITEEDISLRDHTRRHLRAAVIELLVAMDRYRAYVVPGEPAPLGNVLAVEAATAVARGRLPEDAGDAIDLVRDLVLGRPVSALRVSGPDAERRREFVTRFQQTCGPAMAKGVEDTAFYRWHRLVSLNEVGGDPARFGVPVEGFHAFAGRIQQDWPATMTTLSTHDTKRSEDVRARLAVLAETPVEWAEAVRTWSEAAGGHRRPDSWPDPSTIYLLWQTLVGIWQDGPPDPVRVLDYLSKATREAKVHTSWTHPDPLYDTSLTNYVTGVLADEDLMASVGAFCATISPAARVVVLGQKLVQLTMPGVADVYQGTEIVNTTLVDPDNRRAVDFDALAARLARLDSGAPPVTLDDEKLLVTSRALRLRRDHPDCFVGPEAAYTALATSTGNAVAFARGTQDGPRVVTVVTRLPLALSRLGGWREHTVTLPPGTWRDTLTGRRAGGGSQHLATVLEAFPVALLTRES